MFSTFEGVFQLTFDGGLDMSNTMLFVAAIVGLMVVLPGGAFSQEATAPV